MFEIKARHECKHIIIIVVIINVAQYYYCYCVCISVWDECVTVISTQNFACCTNYIAYSNHMNWLVFAVDIVKCFLGKSVNFFYGLQIFDIL